MPKKTDEVRVFYREQNDAYERPAAIVSRDEAREMKAAGEGKFENHGHTFRLHVTAPKALYFKPSQSSESCATISLEEMEANVGCTGNATGEPPIRWLVDAAREKINAIGRRDAGTFDDQAPLAFGRWNPTAPGTTSASA